MKKKFGICAWVVVVATLFLGTGCVQELEALIDEVASIIQDAASQCEDGACWGSGQGPGDECPFSDPSEWECLLDPEACE